MVVHLNVQTDTVNKPHEKNLTSEQIMIKCKLCFYPLSSLDSYFCYDCLTRLPYITTHCESCGLPTNTQLDMCGHCQKQPFAFDHAFSPFEYKPPIQALIHQFKANQLANLKPLQAWLFSAYYHHFRHRKITGLIAIPSSRRSMIRRGHAPAQTLAQLLSQRTHIPVLPNVLSKRWLVPNQKQQTKRSRQTAHQFKFHIERLHAENQLPHRQRNSNQDHRILLIDDVMTTGGSANEAAKHLKAAGVHQVDLLTIARTPMNH